MLFWVLDGGAVPSACVVSIRRSRVLALAAAALFRVAPADTPLREMVVDHLPQRRLRLRV